MEPERASTAGDTRLSRLCYECQLITAVVYLSLDTPPGRVSKLTYIIAACLPQESRPGRLGAGVCWHGLRLSWKLSWRPNGPALQTMRACLVRWSVYAGLFLEVHHRKKLTRTTCARGKRVSPGVLACMGSKMDSIKSLDNAYAHMLLLPGRGACGKQAAVVCTLNKNNRRF